ncbi:MAG: GAF domain-containing protein [Pleurocapsa sp. SU_196_0]|nr:GAF domain-containing protein [Pleurocapsa sp. SU_196_0]
MRIAGEDAAKASACAPVRNTSQPAESCVVKDGSVPTLAAQAAATTVHVLVDLENNQPTLDQVRALVPDVTDVWLFHSGKQSKHLDAFASLGERQIAVPISRPGKNSLDFHLSFYLGYLAAKNPGARLVVMAIDGGYAPMIEHAVKTLGLERGMLGLYSDVRETTAVAKDFYTHNLERLVGDDEQLVISPESFERLVVKNQPIVLNEVSTSNRSFAVGPRELGAEAFLMVPLSARGKPLGVLYVDSTRAGLEITERTVSLARSMAEVASLAIENAQLYAQESQKRQSAEGLREVVLTLSSSLNVSDTLQTILEQANRLLGASGCAVFERVLNALEPRASLGIEDVTNLGRGADAAVVHEALSRLEVVQREENERSVVAAPLFARGESFGGIALYFAAVKEFSRDELGVLTAFAAQAGVALGNARAFSDELTLLEIARLTGSTLSLEEVLKRVPRRSWTPWIWSGASSGSSTRLITPRNVRSWDGCTRTASRMGWRAS